MPTAYKDQFYVMDAGYPPAAGTALTVERFEFIDVNDDGEITSTSADTIEGDTITRVWVNDTITVDVPGVGDVTYTGVTFYTDGVPAVFTPNDGQILQDGTFVSSTYVTSATQTPVGSFGPTCFTHGTMIDVPGGRMPVERIGPGDLVLTRDHGPEPVRSVLRRDHEGSGHAAPVVIAKGVLGNDREMTLSQQHRVLVECAEAELLFGSHEVLVAAVHLVDGLGIRVAPRAQVTYFHLVFDRHEIVTADGIGAESYNLPHALATGHARCGVPSGIVDLIEHRKAPATSMKRPILKRHEVVLMAPLRVVA